MHTKTWKHSHFKYIINIEIYKIIYFIVLTCIFPFDPLRLPLTIFCQTVKLLPPQAQCPLSLRLVWTAAAWDPGGRDSFQGLSWPPSASEPSCNTRKLEVSWRRATRKLAGFWEGCRKHPESSTYSCPTLNLEACKFDFYSVSVLANLLTHRPNSRFLACCRISLVPLWNYAVLNNKWKI